MITTSSNRFVIIYFIKFLFVIGLRTVSIVMSVNCFNLFGLTNLSTSTLPFQYVLFVENPSFNFHSGPQRKFLELKNSMNLPSKEILGNKRHYSLAPPP